MTKTLAMMLASLVLIVFIADQQLHTVVAKQHDVPSDNTVLYSLSNVEIHDGDTFIADVRLGFNVVLTHQTVRLKDFDAYEISAGRRTVKVTSEEIKRGLQAREFVINLLKSTQFKITDGKYDIYNRIVSDVYWLDTKQTPPQYVLLSSTLRKQGYERTNDNSKD